jgi:hypothetical protein
VDVRLPDGTVVKNVPPGTTQADLTARLAKARGPAPFRDTLGPLDQAIQESKPEGELDPGYERHPAKALEHSMRALDVPFRALGNAVMDKFGNPVAATAAYALPQLIQPGAVVKLGEKVAGKTAGKAALKAAGGTFEDVLKQRLLDEGKTGWREPAPITPEQVEDIAKSLEGQPKFPSKPIKTEAQKAGGKQRSIVTPEEITGDPQAGNLDDVLPKVRQGPRVGVMPDLPTQEFPKTTMPAELGGPTEPRPVGTKPVKPIREPGEEGKINPALATKLASTTAGALIGAGLDPDHPGQGAILGAVIGASVGHGVSLRVNPRGFVAGVEKALNPAAQLNLTKEAEIASGIRNAGVVKERLKAFNIPENRGMDVFRAIESGDFSSLLPQEKQAAQLALTEMAKIGTAAQEAGAIPHLKGRYLPHLFDLTDKKTRETLRQMGYDEAKYPNRKGFSTFTPHQLEQTISSYDEAIKLGLKPKTLKLDELFGHYADSVIRATHNKEAITRLTNLKLPDGTPMAGVKGGKGVGADWEPVNGGDTHVPELEGYYVHPDILDSVRLGFSSYDPIILARAASAIGWVGKRLQTAYSMFHPNSIMEGANAQMFEIRHPIKSLGRILDTPIGIGARAIEKASFGKISVPYQSGVDKALKKLRTGDSDGLYDLFIREGLKYDSTLEDRSGYDAFQKILKSVGKVPGAGLPAKAAGAIDKAHQDFTWGYIFTGIKFHNTETLFLSEVQRDMKAAAKAGRAPTPLAKIARDVVSHINATAGGLDWNRIAEGVENKYGRQIAMFAASPRGQAVMGWAGYAPDWMVSTLQPWFRSMGVSGNEATQRYAQNYIVKSLVMEFVIGDYFNYKNSGHHLWKNDFSKNADDPRKRPRDTFDKINDMTYVDRGDGTKQQMFKHLNEFLHMLTEPDKFAVNKAGVVPKSFYEILLNKQYPSVKWAPDIAEAYDSREKAAMKRALWPVKQMMPITGQQGITGGTVPGLWSYFGRPVYGLTEEQRERLRQQKTEDAAEARENR